MFKLVVISGLLAIALAKPSTEVKPENAKSPTIIAEKTIESHGHSIIHNAAAVPVAHGILTNPAVPVTITEIKQVPEKSEKMEPSMEKAESSKEKMNLPSPPLLDTEGAKVLPKPTEKPVELPQKVELPAQEKQMPDPEKNDESKQSRQLLENIKSYQHFIYDPELGTPSYLVSFPLVPTNQLFF